MDSMGDGQGRQKMSFREAVQTVIQQQHSGRLFGGDPSDLPPPGPTLHRVSSSNVHREELTSVPFGAVIHFTNSSVALDMTRPWKVTTPEMSTGTGFYIGEKRIITNSHVVRDTTSLRVTRHGRPGNFEGRVLCDSPIFDLALVTVVEDEFWVGLPSVQFQSTVPCLDDTVIAVGYPLGASSVTLTRGVVSNVQMKDLTLKPPQGEPMLVVQIDAAINPGNSGGPVFNQATFEAVGVAFAGRMDAQGQGFIIPVPVVRQFLNEFKAKGFCNFVPSLAVDVQRLVNPSLRRYALKTAHTSADDGSREGCLVTRVQPLGCCADKVKKGDVLLAIDGEPVSEEAEVAYRGHERLPFFYLITKRSIGETITLTLLRQNTDNPEQMDRLNEQVTLDMAPLRLPRLLGVDLLPEWVIIGGIVFLVASLPLLDFLEDGRRVGENWNLFSTLQKLKSKSLKDTSPPSAVVVGGLLAHAINVDFEWTLGLRIDTYNDVEVQSIAHLFWLHQSSQSQPFTTMTFYNCEGLAVFDNALLQSSEPEILERHCAPAKVAPRTLAAAQEEYAAAAAAAEPSS